MRSLIPTYAAQAGALHEMLEGLSPQRFDAPPPRGAPGQWTLRQIIIHLWDSDLIGVHRMRRVIAEERPLLIGYDESAFIRALDYPRTDPTLAADSFRASRLIMAATLERLPDAAFERWGVHNEVGRKSLADFVKSYIDHVDHHRRIFDTKRRMLESA